MDLMVAHTQEDINQLKIEAEAKAVNNNREIACEYGLLGSSLRQTVKPKMMSN